MSSNPLPPGYTPGLGMESPRAVYSLFSSVDYHFNLNKVHSLDGLMPSKCKVARIQWLSIGALPRAPFKQIKECHSKGRQKPLLRHYNTYYTCYSIASHQTSFNFQKLLIQMSYTKKLQYIPPLNFPHCFCEVL